VRCGLEDGVALDQVLATPVTPGTLANHEECLPSLLRHRQQTFNRRDPAGVNLGLSG
jgi:hypothetical protein